jgi:hypothetical protein
MTEMEIEAETDYQEESDAEGNFADQRQTLLKP